MCVTNFFRKYRKKILQTTVAAACFYTAAQLYAQTGVMESQSLVDWSSQLFTSDVQYDIQQAGIPIPSGKRVISNRISVQLPILIKDPLLALPVDSSNTIEDMVRNGSITLARITEIIEGTGIKPIVFDQPGTSVHTTHTLDLHSIGAALVKHSVSNPTKEPIEQVSSRPYSGIIIDARGALPVHGEYVAANGIPCFFPTIWDENMDRLYDKNTIEPSIAKTQGIVYYDYIDDISRYSDRIGTDPLRIIAREIYGINRTDPVISRNDALKILSVPENRQLLTEGKIVILLDEDRIAYRAKVPIKDDNYYLTYRSLKQYTYENKVPDIAIADSATGLKILMENLNFKADLAELLPQEQTRLDDIAKMINEALKTNEYTITVEGHTASVGKPNGEMNLSIERAQAIIQALVDRGIPRELFTYQGYGGTKPIGDNSTDEGRARNRRVEIILLPNTSYIQRNWQ